MNLDTLIALNDEILALTRAGVPLSGNLLKVNSGSAGRLAALATEIGQRLDAGESLGQVLADPRFPNWYAAVVRAGLESGKLTAALESVAPMLRRQAELRRFAFGAISYPALVVSLAAILFALLFRPMLSQFGMLCRYQSIEMSQPMRVVLQAANQFAPLLPWMAGLAIAALVAAWWVTGRPTVSPTRLENCIPGLAGIIRNGRTAVFLDLLALMLDARLPLPEALSRAADATGHPTLRRDVRRIADRLADGQFKFDHLDSFEGLPPLVTWSLLNDQQTDNRAQSVRGLRDAYYDRTRICHELFRQFFPGMAMLFLGGTAVAAFCLLTLGPYYSLLRTLAMPWRDGTP